MGKRTERWRRAKGKLGEEGPSLLTRHTRAGRRQARKFFGIERAVSCGSPEPGRWGTELDPGSSPSLVVSVFRWAHPFADPTGAGRAPSRGGEANHRFFPVADGRTAGRRNRRHRLLLIISGSTRKPPRMPVRFGTTALHRPSGPSTAGLIWTRVSREYESRCGLRISNPPQSRLTWHFQLGTSRTICNRKVPLANGFRCFPNILDTR